MKKLFASRKKESKVGEASNRTQSSENITSGEETEHKNPVAHTASPQVPPDAHRSLGVKILYEPPKPSDALIDIVFVHGLTGASASTWWHPKAKTPWPASRLSSDLPDSRIITFGYDADVVNFWTPTSQNRIGNHAQNLLGGLTRLREKSDTEERKIIFVAHSLGGLVTQDCLWSSKTNPEPHLQQIDACTTGLLFLGTPNHGADLAAWAKLGTTIAKLAKHANSDIVSVLEPGSEMLARVQNGFHSLLRLHTGIDIVCFHEELPLHVLGKIVETESAIIPGYPHYGIHANHMDMTKFSDRDDNGGYESVSGELRRLVKKLRPAPDVSAGKKPHFLVPFSKDRSFVDRVSIFKELDQRVETQNRMAISGNGGVGKSQIAIEYCYRFKDKHPQAHVVWVHVSTRQRFEQAYQDIARQINIPEWDNPKIDTLQVVFEWFKEAENGQWLMVLDNADDEDMFFNNPAADTEGLERTKSLVDYIPHDSKGFILITTRDNRVGQKLACGRPIVVQPMSSEEAIDLLRSRLEGHINAADEDLKALTTTLDYVPLAITQAAAFMSQYNSTPADYLSMFRSDDSEMHGLLEEDVGDPRRDSQSQNSVTRTWKISFDLINKQNKRAAEMLSLMAVLDRQGITVSLLRTDTDREFDVKKALGTLQAFSLITPQKDGMAFEIHRLVHLATRKWLEVQGTKDFWEGQALKVVGDVFPCPEFESWTTCEILLPHAQTVLKYGDMSINRTEHFATLANYVTMFYNDRGRYDAAYNLSLVTMDLAKSIFGLDHLETLKCMGVLANTYYNLGHFKEAEKLCEQMLKTSTELLGAEHPDTLRVMGNLAITYSQTGHLKEAEKLEEQVLKTITELLGAEHSDTLLAMSNLAITYRQTGHLKEAEKLHEQVIEMRTRVLGSEHPDTLASMHSLAYTYNKQGRRSEAIALMKDAVRVRTKVLGAEHPDTLKSAELLEEWSGEGG